MKGRNTINTQDHKKLKLLQRRKVLFAMMGAMGFVLTSNKVQAFTRFLNTDFTNNVAKQVGLNAIDALELKFYSREEFAFITHLANTIIPSTETLGAVEVGVPVLLDGFFATWANQQTQVEHKSSLETLTTHIHKQQVSLETVSLEQQYRVIDKIDNDAFTAGKSTQNEHYLNAYKALKNIITRTYYSTEEGMTKELRYMLIPGRWDACLKADDNTRAWA